MNKYKIAIITSGLLLGAIIVILLTAQGVNTIASWFNDHTVNVQSPVVITTQKAVVIKERERTRPVVTINYGGETEVIDTEVEQQIVDAFGEDAPIALAVAKAESGLECGRYNINDNGTIDVGLFQINSVHFDDAFGLTEAVDCTKNIEKAREIHEEWGNFNAWVAYWNKSYMAQL